jgi:hypothetical protein
MCPECREQLRTAPVDVLRRKALCFQCYRAGLEHEADLKRAGQLNTATDERFRNLLPLEPVNKPRLNRLRMERAAARARARMGRGQFVDRRRHAQIAARHALQRIAIGLKAREQRGSAEMSALHAADVQLPEAWLPFVAAR